MATGDPVDFRSISGTITFPSATVPDVNPYRVVPSLPSPCPNCGACPTCGRGYFQAVPMPYWQPQPYYWHPSQNPIIWC